MKKILKTQYKYLGLEPTEKISYQFTKKDICFITDCLNRINTDYKRKSIMINNMKNIYGIFESAYNDLIVNNEREIYLLLTNKNIINLALLINTDYFNFLGTEYENDYMHSLRVDLNIILGAI